MALADGVSFLAASSGTATFVFSAARTSYLTLAQAHTAGTLVDGQVVSYLAIDSVSAPMQREWGHGTYSLAGNSVARTTVLGTMNSFTPGSGSPLNFSIAPIVFLTALAEDIPPDPLFLTQGFSLIADNPTIGSDPNFRRGAQIEITYDQLNSNIGFTDQVGLYVNLNFNAGFNQYGASGGTLAKYTPIALNVGGTFVGAGEKFVQSWNGDFWSMGDSFLWSGAMIYTGGPISGDEGQGFTPSFTCNQPNGQVTDTITAVARTGYTTTVTADIVASYLPQNLPVASTVGAVVGDWVILNQAVPSALTQIWAMQILSINPGVSINGVCAINMNASTGHTVSPALVMNTNGQGFECGEGRVLVDYSGASYSTGTVTSISGAAFNGSGTTWTNGMVGGDALNVGAIYLDIDTFTGLPFSVGAPCRSIYQIVTVTSNTQLSIQSFSVAADTSYQGRGLPPATSMTYKVLPAARIMKVNPPGGNWNLVLEHSTHTWTVGDTIECVVCPFPDLHGFDFRMGQWNAGGIRRSFLSLMNNGARTIANGIQLIPGQGSSAVGNAPFDNFAWQNGIFIQDANNGISILDPSNASFSAASAIIITRTGTQTTDTGSSIIWTNWGSLAINSPNAGMDFLMSPNGGTLRCIGSSVNIDTHQAQLVWPGYLQLVSGGGGVAPYLRFGGNNAAGSSITGTMDLIWTSAPRTLSFNANEASSIINAFAITETWSGLGPSGVAVSNVTNANSNLLRLNTSVWQSAAAVTRWAQLQAVPGSGVDDAPLSLQFQIWDNVHDNASFPQLPLEVSMAGLVKIGSYSTFLGADNRVTLDAVSNLTAARTVKFMDTAGDILVAAANTTGAGSAALGANSPAVTNTAPYTWLRMISHDGSTVYVPAWK